MTGMEAWALIAPILYMNLVLNATEESKNTAMEAYLITYDALKDSDKRRKDGERDGES